jgi:hypothetical protein
MIVSICTNFPALKQRKAYAMVDGKSPTERSHNDGRGGAHVYHNGNNSVVVMTDDAMTDDLSKASYVTLTNFEEIFGYRTATAWEDGVATEWETTPAVPEMAALYALAYDGTPQLVDGHLSPARKLWSVPAGYSVEHIL